MAQWKTKVLLGDLHRAHREGEITVSELAKRLAARLEKNRYAAEIEETIDELKHVESVEHYDECLHALYDFGDWDHRIWFDPDWGKADERSTAKKGSSKKARRA